jgi:5-methylthioadenosine/S-adenosylhomocysteine deaminase
VSDPRRILIRGGLVVTQDESLGILDGGDILIEGDRLIAVGESIGDPGEAQVIDARGRIVLPGLIDCHRHLGAGLRGRSVNDSFHVAITNWKPTTVRMLEPADLYMFTLGNALDSLNSGVTTVVDHSNYLAGRLHALEALRGVRDSGIRATWCFGLAGPDGLRTLDERIELAAELWSDEFGGRFGPDQRIQMGVALEEPETVGMDTFYREIRAGRALGVPTLTAHVNCKWDRQSGAAPAQVQGLADVGLLGPDLLFSHMNMTTDEEWDVLREAGSSVCATPETEFGSGMGRSCLRSQGWGVAPAIGFDLSGGPSGNLLTAMRLGLHSERLFRNTADANVVSTHDALRWATVNGAQAIGRSAEIGSLTPGKLADVVLIDMGAINFGGCDRSDPVSLVVEDAHPGNVETVLVGGQIVKAEGRLLVDVDRVIETWNAAASGLRRRAQGALSALNREAELGAYYAGVAAGPDRPT